MNTKTSLIFLTLLVSMNAFAIDYEKKQIYLKFESAYMVGNADKFSAWLADDYKIRQTLHIPGIAPDSPLVTKEQLIASMRKRNIPSKLPRSELSNTYIESVDNLEFCGTSSTKTQITVRRKEYDEIEKRKVCFSKIDDKYLAISHSIDVYYFEK